MTRKSFIALASFSALVVLMAASCVAIDDEKATPTPEAASETGAGIFVFGDGEDAVIDGSQVRGTNPLLNWRDLEPVEGQYDWSRLDQAIAEAEASGGKIVPRILTNASLFGQPSPDWFFETDGAEFYYPSSEAETAEFKAPVAWDPVFQAKFGAFLTALGERYNGNPAIEFFQTNAGGGLYGEMVLTKDDARLPPGWNPDVQRDAITDWLDRWLAAFPETRLSLMVNHLSYDIGEDAADYAAERGVYLQQNTPWLSPEGIAIFEEYQDETAIVLEAEDGCNSTGSKKFDALVDAVFSYGFEIDYLHLCSANFSDDATAAELPNVWKKLRHQD